MATHPNEGKIVFSNLKGLEQRYGQSDAQHVLDCLNVEFHDGFVQRRKGRQQLLNTTLVRPSAVMVRINSGQIIDYTIPATDGDITTTAIPNAFAQPGPNGYLLFIGAPFRFAGIQFFLSNIATSNGTITYNVYQRSSGPNDGAWVPLTVVDHTAVTGNTMKQNGIVAITSYDTSVIQPLAGAGTSAAWTNGTPNSNVGLTVSNFGDSLQDLFWTMVFVNAGITGVNIAEIQLVMQDDGGNSLLTESNGMTEFITKSGNKLIVSTNDYPNLLSNYISPSSSVMLEDENRVSYADLGRLQHVPIRIPSLLKLGGIPGKKISYRVFNNWLIGCTTAGYLWKFDGLTCGILEALAGNDQQNNVVGASAYLKQTPRGTMLEVFQSKLMVAGDPTAPLTFYASLEDNNITSIPANATVGGPNVWPLRYVFSVPSKDGDFITGTSVVNNTYVIFTNSRTFAWDGNVTLTQTNSDVGCIATGSIQRINNSIFFLSEDGFYNTDGINIIPVSSPIWKTLNEMVNWASISNCASSYDKRRNEYKCWLPINGEPQNQFCVIYNVRTESWRFTAGWYPWDTDARRDANSVIQSVSSTCTSVAADGRHIVISCDSNGAFWQEEVGRDDNGVVFPAFLALAPVASQGTAGEDYVNLREWYINTTMDAQWIECFQLGDGDRFDQELDRRFANVPTNSLVVQKQADADNSVASEPQVEYINAPSWPVALNFAKPKKLKFSFGRNLSKMQMILHLTPGQYVAGNYNTSQTPGQGKIFDIQVGVSLKGDGR